MKTTARKILSLVIVVCMAVIGVISAPATTEVAKAASTEYETTAFGEGKLLITTTFNGATYYLPATTTASKAPVATAFTNVNAIGEEHLWTVTAEENNYYIQNSEGKYLYATNTNNGIRIGDTKGTWTYNSSGNYFQYTGLTRYLGIYSAQDWRCYNTVEAANYKESSTSFVFYKVKEAAPELSEGTKNALNEVNSSMSLAFSYTQKTKEAEATDGAWTLVTDVNSLEIGDQVVITDAKATYAMGGQNNNNRVAVSIKKSDDSLELTDSVQILTLEAGTVSNTYAFNTGAGYLYAASSSSNNLKTQTTNNANGSWTISIDGNGVATIKAQGSYTRNWLRKNNSSALFSCYSSGQNDISLYKYEEPSAGETVKEFTNQSFAFKCAVDASLSALEGVESYGIRVTANGKSVNYNADNAASWATETIGEKSYIYVVINLGDDMMNNADKLSAEFTVNAYVIVNGARYDSEKTKTYSVASMVKEYYEDQGIAEVEHLYNYLAEDLGLIEKEVA